MESHSTCFTIDPSSALCPLAASRPISQFPTALPPSSQPKDNSYFSNAPSSNPSRSSTPLSMSLSLSSFSETKTEGHSGHSPCVASSPGPFTPRDWAINSPSIPYSSLVEIYSRPTLPSLSALFPELDECEQDYRHPPKYHGHGPSHQQRRDHHRLSSCDYDTEHIYSGHLTRRSGYHPCEFHEYQPQYQQYQRYPYPLRPNYQHGDEVRAEQHNYASLRPQAQAQVQAQTQAQATTPSAPVSLHLTRSSSPSAAVSSSFSTSPISSSSRFPSFSSSHSPSRPTQHTQHTQHIHRHHRHHRHHPYPSQRYINYPQCDTNKRDMFHSQSSPPPSLSHHTHAHHPHHPSRNNSTVVPPREAPSPLHNIDFVQAKPSSSTSFISSTSSLPYSTSHFSVYSHNQSYQNLLSALPKSSPSTPKVKPSMKRYSRFGSSSPPPPTGPPSPPAHNTTLSADPRSNMKARSVPTPYGSPALTDEELYSDWSRSPSLTRDISMEHGSPQLRSVMEYFDALSEDGSDSTISLISDSPRHHFDMNNIHIYNSPGANIPSSSPASTSNNKSTGKLLLCPVCDKAFKPSKNQNCNLRRHLKNVHDMSPAIHPRKCKWDSLPDGRVKDDKDRKERTRKSKRLWARKFRLRRKVEEAAEVLTMLNQAN